MHNLAFIAMGTNMPHRGAEGAALLRQAVTAMEDAGLNVRSASGVWRTAPWPPGSAQPDYHNAVVAVDAEGLTPEALYARLRRVEIAFGRERRRQWEPRTMDLDIVAMDGLVGRFGDLQLPHPRMHERAFVLAPLAEIAPDWRHPVLGRTTADLLAGLAGEKDYRRVDDLAAAAG